MTALALPSDRMTLIVCRDCRVPKVRAAFRHTRRIGDRTIVWETPYCHKCDRAKLVARLVRKGMVVR